MVGASSGPPGTRAFLWTRREGMQDLGTLPGGTYSRALGMNDAGDVVGTSTSEKGPRAFRWTRRKGMHDLNAVSPLGDPDTVLSEAQAINQEGDIAALSGAGEAEHDEDNHGKKKEHFYRAFALAKKQAKPPGSVSPHPCPRTVKR